MALQQRPPVGPVRYTDVLLVGLVEHHPNPFRQAVKKRLQVRRADEAAGRVVGVGDEQDAGSVCDQIQHGLQIAAEVQRRCGHQLGPAADGGQVKDDEAVGGHDGLAAWLQHRLGGQIKHVVGAVAQGDALRRDAVLGRQGRL